MIVLKALVLALARHAQAGGDGSFANGQNSPDQQVFCALPNLFGEKRRELYNQARQLGRQRQQLKASLGKSGLHLTPSTDTFSKIKNGQSLHVACDAARTENTRLTPHFHRSRAKLEKPAAQSTTVGFFISGKRRKVNVLSEITPQSHLYDPNGKRFVTRTLCDVIAQAQSWEEVMIACEALSNALRIAQEVEGESLREPAQVAAALGQLKELGREIREKGKSDGAAISNATRAADPAVSRDNNGKSDGAAKT
ncbi:MAG TPA: hypothetical protein VIM99_02000 [Blastocatellia bacterium]